MTTTETTARRINWYRSLVERDEMSRLLVRSDWRGLVQAAGHLALLVFTGTAAYYSAANSPVWVLLLILYLHGAIYAFLLNGFHELAHRTVFKSKTLNVVFLHIYGFLGANNPVKFWASHQEHHKYTLYPPDDLEVTLPVKLSPLGFIKIFIVNPWALYYTWKGMIRLSLGRLEGEWENHLFPANDPAHRLELFTWARFYVLGHLLLVGISLAFGQWLLPVLITFAPYYGGGIQSLCNNTQHSGLSDKTPDYRLNCRTIYLSPFLRFVYWNMNYHIEHHMYAGVPCYNLSRLHELIKDDLPRCPNGLFDAWKQIFSIMERQKLDPTYTFVPELPPTRTAGVSDLHSRA
jgi:fatty acid desaturase